MVSGQPRLVRTSPGRGGDDRERTRHGIALAKPARHVTMKSIANGGTPMQVNVLEAKSQLSKLVKAALAGEEVIITRNGEPMVKVPMNRPRKLGGWGRLRSSQDRSMARSRRKSTRRSDESPRTTREALARHPSCPLVPRRESAPQSHLSRLDSRLVLRRFGGQYLESRHKAPRGKTADPASRLP